MESDRQPQLCLRRLHCLLDASASIREKVCRVEDVGAGVKSAATRLSHSRRVDNVSRRKERRVKCRAVTIFVLSVVEMVPASSTVPFQTDFLLAPAPD